MRVGEIMRSGTRVKRIMPNDTIDTDGSTSEPTENISKAGCGKNRRGGQRAVHDNLNMRISRKSPIKHKNKLGLETSVAKDIYALENEYSNRKKFPIPLSRIIMMAGELGGYKYGKFGLLSYLTHIMEKDYKTYCNLLAKCVNSMDRVSLSELGLTDGNKKIRLEIVGLSESNDSDKPPFSTVSEKSNTINLRGCQSLDLKESKEKIIEAEYTAVVGEDTISGGKNDTNKDS